MNTNQNKKPDYGQDMPGILIIATVISLALWITAGWQYNRFITNYFNYELIISLVLALIASLFIVFVISGIWSSRFGKLLLRDKVLDNIVFKGSETILDLGCGKGLLLIEAAKKLSRGKAVGADLWAKTLEFKYSPQMVMDNAVIENVTDRIEIVSADAQDLPFDSNSFNIVMTSLMMHHVPDKKKALQEMFRVLKPGGTLVIADVNSKPYIPLLKTFGLEQMETIYATRLFLVPTYIIKGVKPE
jgi:arsenite methyltransferase